VLNFLKDQVVLLLFLLGSFKFADKELERHHFVIVVTDCVHSFKLFLYVFKALKIVNDVGKDGRLKEHQEDENYTASKKE